MDLAPLIGLVIALSAALYWVLLRRRGRFIRTPESELRNRTPFGLIADTEKLERAEREAKLFRAGDLAVAAVLRSDRGHTEASVMELLVYLGSEGIDATYQTNSVGVGGVGLIQYSLKVPPDQLEKTRALLEVKLMRG